MPAGGGETGRAFYGGLWQLNELTPPAAVAALNEIWYQLGDTELHLFEEMEHFADRTARHFCIAVDDVESLRSRLETAGVGVVGATAIPGRPRYFAEIRSEI